MKSIYTKLLSVLELSLVCFIFFSCSKLINDISYPASGGHGINVLALPDNDSIASMPVRYSLCADLDIGASLKITFSMIERDSVAGGDWFYAMGSGNGWDISTWSDGSQEFKSSSTGTIDLQMAFYGKGSCRIDFYENSNVNVAHSQILNWSY